MSKVKIVIFLVFATVLSGCVSYGQLVDTGYVTKIKKGETTEQEILKNLGNPMAMKTTPEGLKLYVYYYVKGEASAVSFIPVVGSYLDPAKAEATTLKVWIDENGVVSDFTYVKDKEKQKSGLRIEVN